MSAPATPSLLGIPAELRNKIYEHALFSPKPFRLLKTLAPPPLCRTSRQIRAESIKMWRAINEFEVDTYHEWHDSKPTVNDLSKRLQDVPGIEEMPNITWVNSIALNTDFTVAKQLWVVLVVRGQEYVVQAAKGPYNGPEWEHVWCWDHQRERVVKEAEGMLKHLEAVLGRPGLVWKGASVHCQAGGCKGHPLERFDEHVLWDLEAQCWDTWKTPWHRK